MTSLMMKANEDDQPVDVALLFDHFSDMLSYDPDMGVVFASPRIRDNTRTFFINRHTNTHTHTTSHYQIHSMFFSPNF